MLIIYDIIKISGKNKKTKITKTEVIKMLLKDAIISKMAGQRKRVSGHKKGMSNQRRILERPKAKEVIKDNNMAKAETTEKVVPHKRKKVVRKRPSKEAMDEIKKRAEEKAYKGIISGEKFPGEEPTHEISKGERAERFKKLHAMAVQMTNKWKEENQ